MKEILTPSFKKMAQSKIDETKPIGEGEVYSPKNEDEWVDKTKGHKLHRRAPRSRKKNPDDRWDEIINKMHDLPSYSTV